MALVAVYLYKELSLPCLSLEPLAINKLDTPWARHMTSSLRSSLLSRYHLSLFRRLASRLLSLCWTARQRRHENGDIETHHFVYIQLGHPGHPFLLIALDFAVGRLSIQ